MARVNVFRNGMVHVRAEQCDHCLLSKDRLVDSGRARDLIASTRSIDGATFVCHRSQISDEREAICAAWWDRFATDDFTLRLAIAMDAVEFVTTGCRSSTTDRREL